MFTNPYDAQVSADAARRKEMREIAQMDAYDYHAYQAGQSSAGAGRALGGMLGMQTPEQAKQDKIEEIMGQYGEGTKSYEQLMQIADSFRSANMPDLWQEVMDMADKLKPTESTESTDMKKWQYQIAGHKQAIADYAKSKNYTLTNRQLDNLVSSTKAKPTLNQLGGEQVSGWVDIVDQALAGMKPNVAKTGGDSDGDVSATGSTDTSLTPIARLGTLENVQKNYRMDTKESRTALESVEDGLSYVQQHRGGISSARPNITKVLAQMNNDNRLSQPEVVHAMKFGGLGDRIARSMSLWITGDIPDADLDDIERMFKIVGQISEQRLNERNLEYRFKYKNSLTGDELDTWLPKKPQKYLTDAQKLELAREVLRKRGK